MPDHHQSTSTTTFSCSRSPRLVLQDSAEVLGNVVSLVARRLWLHGLLRLRPLPEQRAAIASRQTADTTLYPPDWQCPNQRCQNHTKMVFAKRDKCPICGTSKPRSITCNSGTESMSGGTIGGFTLPLRTFHQDGSAETDERILVRLLLLGTPSTPPRMFRSVL